MHAHTTAGSGKKEKSKAGPRPPLAPMRHRARVCRHTHAKRRLGTKRGVGEGGGDSAASTGSLQLVFLTGAFFAS